MYKYKNSENVFRSEAAEVVLVYSNIVNNNYHQNVRVICKRLRVFVFSQMYG